MLAPVVSTARAANPETGTNNFAGMSASPDNGLEFPQSVPADYWLIKSFSMRTLACLCANKYPVGLGAGKNSDFTFRIIKNQNGNAVSIHSLCVRKNKGWNKRVVGKITLPLTYQGEIQISPPGDARNNANAAVLSERMKGGNLIPFRRKNYRISRCPTNPEHYKGLNWTQPERWPAM